MLVLAFVVATHGQPSISTTVSATASIENSFPHYGNAQPTPYRPSMSDLSTSFGVAGQQQSEQDSTIPYSSEAGATAPPLPFVEDKTQFAPDLSIDTRPAVVDWSIDEVLINGSSCAVQEGCVEPGLRKLLRFNTRINNLGTADFVPSFLSVCG